MSIDEANLESFLVEHRPRLLAMLRGRMPTALSARLDAEDLLSDAYVLARRKWTAFRPEQWASLYAWLYHFDRDRLFDAWRQHCRLARSPQWEVPWPEPSSAQLALRLQANLTGPSTAAVRNEQHEALRKAIDELRPQDRELIKVRHFEHLSFAEAAQILGITRNAANVRYVRALERLKKQLMRSATDWCGD